MNGSFSINEGVLWLLIAALCLTSYNILQRKLTKTYSALESSTYSIFFATTTILGFVMINEIPNKATILGGIIILSGLFIFNKEIFLEPLKNKELKKTENI